MENEEKTRDELLEEIAELRKILAENETFFEHAPGLFISIDAINYQIIHCNETSTKKLGYTKNELLGKTIFDVLTPQSAAYNKKKTFSIFSQTGLIRGEELQIQCKDGKILEYSLDAKAVKDDKGNIQRARLVLHDLTEQKKARRELKNIENKYQLLAESIDEVFWIVSSDWSKVHYINPAYEKVWGKSVESLYFQPLSWMDSVLEEDLQVIKESIQKVSNKDFPEVSFPMYRIRRPDGTIRWIQSKGFSMKDAQGKTIGVAGIASDITKRQRTLEMLDSIINNVPALISYVDTNERYIFANSQYEEVFGVNQKDIQGLQIREVIGEENYKTAQKYIQKALSGEIASFENKIKFRDKSEHYLFAEFIPDMSEFGPPKGLYIFVRDITEHKNAEMKLRKSEERLSLTMEATRDALWDWDLSTNTIFWSPQAYRILGYEVDEFPMTYKKWLELVHPDDLSKCEMAIRKSLEKNKAFNTEFRFRCKDGSWLWVFGRGKCVERDENGKALRMLGSHFDLTVRKKVETALQRQNDLNESILDTVQAIILLLDTQGRIVKFNRFMENLSGYTLEETKGKDWFSTFLRSEDSPKIRPLFQKAIKNISTCGNVNPIVTKDGKWIDIEWYDNVLKDSNGNTAGLLAFGIDITERKKTEEALRNAQRLKSLGLLAGGIAHDFNNLLCGILGNIDLARYSIDDKVCALEFLDNAISSFERAKGLTRQLLTFSKGGSPFKEKISFDSLVKETAELCLSKSNVSYTLNLSEKTHTLEADPNQIRQVLNNILNNAVESMPNGGHIQIEIQETLLEENQISSLSGGKYILICIKDEGCGIPKDDIAKVFDPFFTSKKEGSGLGLAISYSIIQKHNGVIHIKSQVKKGTTVSIYLPAFIEVNQRKKTQVQEKFKIKNRILLMDDERIVRDVVKKMLTLLGFEVTCSKNGEEAIDFYAQELKSGRRFDAVILDLTIQGGLGGEQTIKRLIQIDPNVIGIVSSGYSDSPVLANPQNYGFVGKLEKPYTKLELSKILKSEIQK